MPTCLVLALLWLFLHPTAVPTPTISSSVTNGSVVAVGTDVMLTCTSSSTFEIIVWTFGSSPLPPEATVMDGVLTLPDVTVARSGFYVCTFDGKSASFEITVEPGELSK